MRLGIRDALAALRLARVSRPFPGSLPGLTRQSIRFAKSTFASPSWKERLRRRWTRGSSPRVTTSACIASRRALVSRTSAASALARAQRDPGPSARIAKLHTRFRNSASCGPWVPALRSHTLASAGTRELLASPQLTMSNRECRTAQTHILPSTGPAARSQPAPPPLSRRNCSSSSEGGAWSSIRVHEPSSFLTEADLIHLVAQIEDPREDLPVRRAIGHTHGRAPRRPAADRRQDLMHPGPGLRRAARAALHRRRRRSRAAASRLWSCTHATAASRHGRQQGVARRGGAPPRSASCRRARVVSSCSSPLPSCRTIHLHSPPRSRGAFLRPGGVLVIASIPDRGAGGAPTGALVLMSRG